MSKSISMDEAKTPDEISTALLQRMDTAVKTIEELTEKVEELEQTISSTTIEDVGMDDVFMFRDLPGIIRMLRDLPEIVRKDPCRVHELDRLMSVLLQVDGTVR